MLLVDGEKYACIRCIRGHRSSTCKHTQRPLVQVRKRGRPVADCNHRLAVLPDGSCECGVAAIILPRGAASAGPMFQEIEGGKRKILDTSDSPKVAPSVVDLEDAIHLHKVSSEKVVGDFRIHKSQRVDCCAAVPADRAFVVKQETSSGSCCDAELDKPVGSCCGVKEDVVRAKPTPTSSVSASSSSTSLSSMSSHSSLPSSHPVKLRSIVMKSDVNSPAVVQSLGSLNQSRQFIGYGTSQGGLYDQLSLQDAYEEGDGSDLSPSAVYDAALYSLETYLAGSLPLISDSVSMADQNVRPSYSDFSAEQQVTLSTSQVEALTRYSSRSGVISYPGYGNQASPFCPTDLIPSQVNLRQPLSPLQEQEEGQVGSAAPMAADFLDGDGTDSIDNLFSVYLTATCAVPGGECLCSENCNCAGCMKHGNFFVDEN